MLKILFAAAVLCAASAAAAAEPAAVTIPLLPPVGKPLHYRQATTGGPGGATQADLTVAFRRSGEGYLMTYSYALPQGAPASDPLIALLTRPVTVRVSKDAEITAVEDEAAYLASLEKAYAGATGPAPAASQFVRDFVARLQALSPQARIAFLTQNLAPLLRYAATRHQPGEAIGGEEETDTPFGHATQTVTQTLERVSGGVAHFTLVSQVPPEQLTAMLKRLAAEAPTNGKPPSDFTILASGTSAEADVEIATGLLRHFSQTRSVTVSEGGKKETVERGMTLDLID